MKKYLLGLTIALYLSACGDTPPSDKPAMNIRQSDEEKQGDTRPEKKAYDPKRGEGK